ncbi:JAB domain-containing protein [Chloroflexota bacterium]
METEDLFTGTINSSSVSSREVVENAIKHSAASLIFSHNHPSGNPQPNNNDKDVTKDLVFACSIMKIKVLDHVIIGNNRYFSFAGQGLIDEYELDFLNLKIKGVKAPHNPYHANVSSPKLPWQS